MYIHKRLDPRKICSLLVVIYFVCCYIRRAVWLC